MYSKHFIWIRYHSKVCFIEFSIKKNVCIIYFYLNYWRTMLAISCAPCLCFKCIQILAKTVNCEVHEGSLTSSEACNDKAITHHIIMCVCGLIMRWKFNHSVWFYRRLSAVGSTRACGCSIGAMIAVHKQWDCISVTRGLKASSRNGGQSIYQP